MYICCEYGFLPNMITYIGNNINNATEKTKYSTLNVFREFSLYSCVVHIIQFRYDRGKSGLGDCINVEGGKSDEVFLLDKGAVNVE